MRVPEDEASILAPEGTTLDLGSWECACSCRFRGMGTYRRQKTRGLRHTAAPRKGRKEARKGWREGGGQEGKKEGVWTPEREREQKTKPKKERKKDRTKDRQNESQKQRDRRTRQRDKEPGVLLLY